MASSILFFGDGSVSLHPAYSKVLQARKDGTLLSLFLGRARLALQHEIFQIPLPQRKGMPDLAELEILIPKPGENRPDHQCLAPAMLVIIQLGQFISWYEAHPEEPYPEPTSAITIGLCVGQLSAIAVSQARSLTELIPLAVESVRIAFRTGFTAITIRDELEQQTSENDTWAMTVSRDVGLLENDLLAQIHRKTGVLQRKTAYVSASFRKALTLQGPPSTLDKIESWLASSPKVLPKNSVRRIPIYTPYHAPHLYSDRNILEISNTSDSESNINLNTEVNSPHLGLVSPVTGKLYTVCSRQQMLQRVLYDVLKQPIEWNNVTAGCVEYVNKSEYQKWTVRPFGPTFAAGSLVSALISEAKVDAVLDDFFASSDPPQQGAATKEPIAIVGLAGRFPEAIGHDELWKLLEQGIDCHKVIPVDRFDPEVYVDKDGEARNPTGTPYGCFMKEPGMFDAKFFNLSPREAEQTDPQQRLALMTAYEALEMSGFVPNRTPSTQLDRIGTYYGQTGDDYREINASQDVQTYYISGNDRAFGPGRINHHFKFGGPSMSIDTACSSSAVALNVACTALWANDCDTALVGGMTLLSSSDTFCGLTKGHFLNDTGNCKTFDDAADGYCRGEAVATVVVKRLSDAQADNDNILAVIVATGTNYSAASASITHPHGPTQEVLYRRLLNQAGIQPFDIDYVEMHGTGTQAGDAAEMSSVSNVFAPAFPNRPSNQPLWLGSVKANVGHGESASGVTALIKTLLVLREQTIPPHVGIKSGVMNRTFPNLKERNIKIALDGPAAFPCRQGRRRRALVNNFGAAGGNTALLIEEAPTKNIDGITDNRPVHVINITAKTALSIQNNIRNLITYLENNPNTSLSDLSYTTTARRMNFPIRLSLTASSIGELRDRLTSTLTLNNFKPSTKISNVIFAFTGQGSLYLPLAKDLFESSNQFKTDLIRFDQICQDLQFPGFLSVVNGDAADIDDLSPVQTQTAITAVQMSLCRLWASWGVNPTAVIGHSLGEYAALYACGVLSANDVLYLVGQRATILERSCTQKSHSMLSVHATHTDILSHLGRDLQGLEVACINGPEDIVLSGTAPVIQQALDCLKSTGVKCTILNTPYAFHSAQIDPILDSFESAAQSVEFWKPVIPLISPLLGSIVKTTGIIGPSYLRRHAREAVNFKAALDHAAAQGLGTENTIWVEIGPNPVCLGMVKSTLGNKCNGIASLRKNEHAWTTAARATSTLYSLGLNIDWNEYHRDFERGQNVMHLPAYSFEEKSYWTSYKNDWALRKGDDQSSKPCKSNQENTLTTTVHRLISKQTNGKLTSLMFETDLSELNMHAIIAGHSLNGLALCPAGVYADMALTVADYVRKECRLNVPTSGINVTEMEILGPITVPVPRVASPQLLHITATVNLETGKIDIGFGSYSSETQKTGSNAKCQVIFADQKVWLHDWSRNAYLIQKRIQHLQRGVLEGTTDKIFKKMAYQLFSSLVIYGPKYQGMQEVLVNSDELEATASLKLHEGTDIGNFFASPLWIDNLAQLSGFVMNAIGIVDPRSAVYISHGWGSLQLVLPIDPKRPLQVHVKMQPLDKTIMAGNVSIFQDDTMVGLLGDVKFQRVPRSLLDTMLSSSSATKLSDKQSQVVKASNATLKALPEATSPPEIVSKPAVQRESPINKVLNVIAEEVGISINELNDDSDFSELGVDSLLSLTILSKIREMTQIDLSPTTFQECQTIADLKQSLGADLSSIETDSCATMETPMDSGARTPEEVSGAHTMVADDITEVIQSTIAAEIGVEVDELLATDDLSALGVDSLMSLSIIAALREKIGMQIPPNALEESFSLNGIKKALNIHQTSPTQKNMAVKTYTAQSLLLQGKPSTASKTLFLFPDGSGSATSYAELPEIAANICVYAINSPFLKSPAEYKCNLEQIALLMIDEVRARQSQGPYLLGGWSAGGMYAYEAAKYLIESGETVEKLILIDSPCRLDYGPMPQDVLEYVSRSGVISGGKTGTAPQWLVDHFQGTIQAVREYSPKPFTNPSNSAPDTCVIWAKKGVFEDWPKAELAGLDLTDAVARWLLKPKIEPGTQGWEKLLSSEKMSCMSVDGNHFSMVHPPNCASLSQAIADAIENDPMKRLGQWRKA